MEDQNADLLLYVLVASTLPLPNLLVLESKQNRNEANSTKAVAFMELMKDRIFFAILTVSGRLELPATGSETKLEKKKRRIQKRICGETIELKVRGSVTGSCRCVRVVGVANRQLR
eukprot:TRINITY_DN3326_c0_g2_i3.p1 TRINITY_DN3326_c0_g2~~TRINITY_DN3326_c0_g2_i3.p1  ORF type:complete len:116 (+),score=10.77 TRINITY_DN3326_c0_g2_i3:5-352(+)